MPEGNEGEGNAQKGQEGDEGSQPFKVYKTEQEFGSAMDKKFRSGYNEARSKDLEKVGSVLGAEFEDIEQATGKIKELQQQVSDGIEDPTQAPEYKDLQSKFKGLKEQLDELKNQNQDLQLQNEVDRQINDGFMSVKQSHQFEDATVDEADVRELFEIKYGSKRVDGKIVATRKDPQLGEQVPITDEEGNHKPYKEVFADFAKKYAVPRAEGAGGGTGGGEASTKPKRSEYRKAVRSGDEETATKLEEQAEQAGGFNEDVEPVWQ